MGSGERTASARALTCSFPRECAVPMCLLGCLRKPNLHAGRGAVHPVAAERRQPQQPAACTRGIESQRSPQCSPRFRHLTRHGRRRGRSGTASRRALGGRRRCRRGTSPAGRRRSGRGSGGPSRLPVFDTRLSGAVLKAKSVLWSNRMQKSRSSAPRSCSSKRSRVARTRRTSSPEMWTRARYASTSDASAPSRPGGQHSVWSGQTTSMPDSTAPTVSGERATRPTCCSSLSAKSSSSE